MGVAHSISMITLSAKNQRNNGGGIGLPMILLLHAIIISCIVESSLSVVRNTFLASLMMISVYMCVKMFLVEARDQAPRLYLATQACIALFSVCYLLLSLWTLVALCFTVHNVHALLSHPPLSVPPEMLRPCSLLSDALSTDPLLQQTNLVRAFTCISIILMRWLFAFIHVALVAW